MFDTISTGIQALQQQVLNSIASDLSLYIPLQAKMYSADNAEQFDLQQGMLQFLKFEVHPINFTRMNAMKVIDSFDKIRELVNQRLEVNDIIVDFNNKNLTIEAIQQLIALINSIPSAKNWTLKLRKNNINADGAQHLANFLLSENCPQHLILDLYENQIGYAGAQYFSEAIESGRCRKNMTINLENNGIGATGAELFATALSGGRCPDGLTLHIGGNNIAAEGAQAFAQSLATGKWPRDVTIDFIYSEIGAAGGGQFLAHTLQHAPLPANLVLKDVPEALKIVRPAYKLLAKKWLLLTGTDTGANAQELNQIYVQHSKLSKICLHTLADAMELQQAQEDFIALKNHYKNFLIDVLKKLSLNTTAGDVEAINALRDTRETIRVVLNDWISSLQYNAFKILPANLQGELRTEVSNMRLTVASAYMTALEWAMLKLIAAPDTTSPHYLQAQQALAVRASLLQGSEDLRSNLLYLRSVLQLAQSLDGKAIQDDIITVTAESVTHHPKYEEALRHMQYAQCNLHSASWVSTIERIGKTRSITLTGPRGKTLYRSFAGLTLKRQSYDDGSFVRRSAQSSTSSTSQTKDDAELTGPAQIDNSRFAKK